MIRFVGYRNDSTGRALIFEGEDSRNWVRSINDNGGRDRDDASLTFILIDFRDKVATIMSGQTGRTGTIDIDPVPVRADYLVEVIKEMEDELDGLVTLHGVTETR